MNRTGFGGNFFYIVRDRALERSFSLKILTCCLIPYIKFEYQSYSRSCIHSIFMSDLYVLRLQITLNKQDCTDNFAKMKFVKGLLYARGDEMLCLKVSVKLEFWNGFYFF